MIWAVGPVLDYTIVRVSIVLKAPQIRVTQNVETLISVIAQPKWSVYIQWNVKCAANTNGEVGRAYLLAREIMNAS